MSSVKQAAISAAPPIPAQPADLSIEPGVARQRVPTWPDAWKLMARSCGPNPWIGTLPALAAALRLGLCAPLAVVKDGRQLRLYDVRSDGGLGDCLLAVEVVRP